MRVWIAIVFVSTLVAGCTPFIPVKDDFGVSALMPAGDLPQEFSGFNAYDPKIASLLANQICVTPYVQLEEKNLGASPGRLIQAKGRCQTHRPLIGDAEIPGLIP